VGKEGGMVEREGGMECKVDTTREREATTVGLASCVGNRRAVTGAGAGRGRGGGEEAAEVGGRAVTGGWCGDVGGWSVEGDGLGEEDEETRRQRGKAEAEAAADEAVFLSSYFPQSLSDMHDVERQARLLARWGVREGGGLRDSYISVIYLHTHIHTHVHIHTH